MAIKFTKNLSFCDKILSRFFVTAKINFEAPSACQKNLGANSTNSREYDSLDLSADDSRVIHKDGFVLVDLRKNSSILKVPKIPTGNNDATIQSLQGMCIEIYDVKYASLSGLCFFSAAGSESLLVQALSTPTLIEPTGIVVSLVIRT